MTSPAYALSWLVPETRSARIAGIRAYWDDPLNLALARRQVCKAGLHDMTDEANRVEYRRGCAACHRDYNAAWWRRHGAEKRRQYYGSSKGEGGPSVRYEGEGPGGVQPAERSSAIR